MPAETLGILYWIDIKYKLFISEHLDSCPWFILFLYLYIFLSLTNHFIPTDLIINY